MYVCTVCTFFCTYLCQLRAMLNSIYVCNVYIHTVDNRVFMPLLTFLRSAVLTGGCMYGGGRWQHEVSRAAAVPHEK